MTPELSIAIPFYNEEKIIELLVKELIDQLMEHKIDYELILINNGAKDRTEEIIKELSSKDRRIKPLKIEINQGYGFGVGSGLKKATGNYIGYMDGDFEVLPEDVIKVYKKAKETNADVCKGVRLVRAKGMRKLASVGYDLLFFF